jgi:hypothetical protein
VTLALLALACSGAPDTAPTADKDAAEAAALAEQAPPAPPPPAPSDELVPVEIVWGGVGKLYKTYFQDQQALTELSGRLAPYVNAPAQLKIWYDSDDFVGGIRLIVPPGGWRTPPAAGRGAVDLQALAPVTVALATYRDAIAAKYDLRVQSLFAIGVDLIRGSTACEIEPIGEPPPDGRTVSPCPRVNGTEVCGMTGAGGVTFSGEDWAKVSPCFDQ